MAYAQTIPSTPQATCRSGSKVTGLVLTNVLATTEAVDWRQETAGILMIPAAYAAVLLTLYASTDEDGTYLPLTDSEGNAITMTIASSKAVEIPVQAFAAPWLKFVQDANDADPVTLVTKG